MASVANDLATAAAAIVDTFASAGTVHQRKAPVRLPGETGAVHTVVTVDEARDFEPASAYDDGAWYGYYRLTVARFAQHAPHAEGVAGETSLTDPREFKQRIRRAINVLSLPANGATHVDDCDPVARPTFDRRGLDKKVDVTVVQFIVRTMEPRDN